MGRDLHNNDMSIGYLSLMIIIPIIGDFRACFLWRWEVKPPSPDALSLCVPLKFAGSPARKYEHTINLMVMIMRMGSGCQ